MWPYLFYITSHVIIFSCPLRTIQSLWQIKKLISFLPCLLTNSSTKNEYLTKYDFITYNNNHYWYPTLWISNYAILFNDLKFSYKNSESLWESSLTWWFGGNKPTGWTPDWLGGLSSTLQNAVRQECVTFGNCLLNPQIAGQWIVWSFKQAPYSPKRVGYPQGCSPSSLASPAARKLLTSPRCQAPTWSGPHDGPSQVPGVLKKPPYLGLEGASHVHIVQCMTYKALIALAHSSYASKNFIKY